jgi:RHS repeat-associated protein
MTDAAGLKVHSWVGYPFGKQYGGVVNTNYLFTGKEIDNHNGFYYFGARYYMPEIGRFITPEPIMGTGDLNINEPIALNFYNYSKDNPLKYVDPNGKREMTPREVEIAYQIITQAEQIYFHLLGEAERTSIGSWPADIAASKMDPISLKGLPGDLALGYKLKLLKESIFSIFDPRSNDPSGLTGTLPTGG